MVLGVVGPCGPRSTFLLVVGASGLCTPGPVCPDGVLRPSTLFLLRGIRRAAPAQVTACRVVTLCRVQVVILKKGYKGYKNYFNDSFNSRPFLNLKLKVYIITFLNQLNISNYKLTVNLYA